MGRIDVTKSPELMAAIAALNAMDRTVSAAIRKYTKAVAEPEWRKAIHSRASSALEVLQVKVTERALDEVSKPTALIRSRSVGRSAATPISHRDVGLLLTLISPHTDADRAMDQLEDFTSEVLDWLDTSDIRHGDATTTAWDDSRLAIDIPITVFAQKE